MNIDEIRGNIDIIDDSMLELFLRRMELSAEASKFKSQRSLPILDKSREREILARVTSKSGDMERYSHRLFTTIMELSKSYQDTLRCGGTKIRAELDQALSVDWGEFPAKGVIGCQGVEGAYSQIAADKLFPRGNLMYFKTFEAVFDAVKSGLCDYGVVPVENSSNGSVRASYELLKRKNVHIVRSERICIRHELLAKPGTKLEDVREIRSHGQALGQCGEFLKKLNGVRVIECANTAEAAEYAANCDEAGVAAIASGNAGKLYGLGTIADDIQDTSNNYTRFVCISREPKIFPGADRISLLVGCDHRPGALYELIAKPTALGINMLKLESMPIVGHDFEFMFIIDMQASVRDSGTAAMLESMERECALFRFLGCYSEV